MAKPNFGPEAGRNGDKFQGTISAIVLVPNPHQPLFQNRPNPSFSLPSDWSLLPTFPIPFPIFQWTTTAASSPARGSTEWPTGWAPVWPQPSSLPWNAARASTSAPATWMKMKKKPRIAPSCSPSPSPNTAPISASMSISFPFFPAKQHQKAAPDYVKPCPLLCQNPTSWNLTIPPLLQINITNVHPHHSLNPIFPFAFVDSCRQTGRSLMVGIVE